MNINFFQDDSCQFFYLHQIFNTHFQEIIHCEVFNVHHQEIILCEARNGVVSIIIPNIKKPWFFFTDYPNFHIIYSSVDYHNHSIIL